MKANELLKRIESKNPPVVVDARSEFEFKRGHIPGAINAPVRKILLNRAHLPRDRNSEMVIACMHGQRAATAKWLLSLYGYRNTSLLEGHLEGWQDAGLPLEISSRNALWAVSPKGARMIKPSTLAVASNVAPPKEKQTSFTGTY